jgi:hypothetical protein
MTPWTPEFVERFVAALVRTNQSMLATMARHHVERDGRGLVVVTCRGEMPDPLPAAFEMQIGYRPRAEYARLTATQTGDGRLLADHILRRLDTYNPATAMVVAIICGPTFWTTPLTLPLDAPVITAEADGVH